MDETNNITIEDPYRWLEDPDNPKVKKWIEEHNKQIEQSLKTEDSFSVFSQELIKNFKVVNFSNPVPFNGRYFYTERQPDEDQHVLYVKDGLTGQPRELFNPNGKKDDNTITIDYWVPSKTGKYLVYGLSEGGAEMATLYVKNVDLNQNLSDQIPNCRYSSIQWLPDDSGFFYTRNPKPGAVPAGEEHLHTKVYFHHLGDNPDNDKLIFGEGRPKDDMVRINLSPDGKYLAINVSQTWTENDIYLYERESAQIKPLVIGLPFKFSVRFLRDKILLVTNHQANNYRVLSATYDDLYKPIDQWDEFIPEQESLLDFLRVSKSKILVGYLVNVCSEVITFDHNGNKTGKIPLSRYSSFAGISARIEEEEFFYGVDSFVFPKIAYRYDPETSQYSEYRKTDNPINPEDYEVKQEWCVSKDGTKIPMFIVHKKGIELNSNNPTILYGYGGFNSNSSPMFMRNWVPWISRGGIFATANIRGGGEFGDSWHKAGIKDKKQNTFDDFIAAAEHLISQKYTDRNHLGILGGSNGGLLVSAVGVQRPDLFKAVCSRVPLTDMVRFPKFGIAVRWVHEYGNPEIEAELKNILTWSPYHNVKEGVKYPDFLFTTADKDTRVDPLHARKMAARLIDANKKNEVFVLTEIEAGHGPGKPIAKIVESQAVILAFFACELNLFKDKE